MKVLSGLWFQTRVIRTRKGISDCSFRDICTDRKKRYQLVVAESGFLVWVLHWQAVLQAIRMWPDVIHHICHKEKEVMSDGSGEPGATWMDWCPSHLEEGE